MSKRVSHGVAWVATARARRMPVCATRCGGGGGGSLRLVGASSQDPSGSEEIGRRLGGGVIFLINAAVNDSRHRNGLPTVNSTLFDLKGDQSCAYRHRHAVAHQQPHPASAAAAALYLGRAAAATALVPCAAGGVPRWRRAGPPTHSGRPPSHSRRRPRPHRTPSGRCLPPWRPVSVRPIALATPRVSCPS